ncbi:MAG: septation protein SepH [Jatrophihabitantaceae bacterium]
MRALRFVGLGDDGHHVIVETADGAERFALSADVGLRDALRRDLPAPHPAGAQPDSAISPREIQMRVRAGASPQALAEKYSMALERVLLFAGPVVGERTRIADEARRAKARRSTDEGQTVVFGEAVEGRFTAHGIDPSTVSWDAYRREDGQWIVTASWLGGDADRVAEWVFHLAARIVTPLDDTAADLLSDRPIHPMSAAEDPARPSLVMAPRLARGVVAFPPMSDPHGAAPARTVRVEEVFDQDALDLAPQPAGAHRTAAAGSDSDPDYPPELLPLRLADAADAGSGGADVSAPADAPTSRLPRVTNLGVAGREGASDEERGARPRIPSWDDIMLGVRRKRD